VPPDVELIVADLPNRKVVEEVFASCRFDGVLHFAALSLVGESMREPLRHMAENLSNILWLAEAAVKAGCMRYGLPSTAALFGFPKYISIDEDAETGASFSLRRI
jgi:UDP-glucose 4-epimerase